jgi:hypothetical protein
MAVILLAVIPVAWSHGGWHGDRSYGGHKMGHVLQRIDVPIAITGTKGDTSTFMIKDMGIQGKEDKAAVMTFDTPLNGACNASSDMAYISTKNAKQMNLKIASVNESSLGVAGASAIMSMKDIKVLYKGKDYTLMEFGNLSMHMPDGTVKSYSLEKPVKLLYSQDRDMLVMDAYPDVTKVLKESLVTGKTYPADAPPISLKSLIDSEAGSSTSVIGYAKPPYISPAEIIG